MAYVYAYYGFDMAAIKDVESLLNSAGQDVVFKHAGSMVSAISVRMTAKKPTVMGIILNESEYASIESKYIDFEDKIKTKVKVLHSFDELKAYMEDELEVPLDAPTEDEVPSEPVLNDFGAGTVKMVTPSSQQNQTSNDFQTSEAEDQESSVLNAYQGEKKLVLGEKSFFTRTFDSNTVETSTPSSVPIEEPEEPEAQSVSFADQPKEPFTLNAEKPHKVESMFDDDLDAELEDLKRQNDELTHKLESAKQELARLEKVRSDFNESVQVSEDLRDRISQLTTDKFDLEQQLREAQSGRLELPAIDVPSNVNFYVSASSLSLVKAYDYLLREKPTTTLIDLSRESYLDMLVQLNHPNRVTKWLLEGINIRTLNSSYSQREIQPATGLNIVSSPNALIPEDAFKRADWDSILNQLQETYSEYNIFLGVATHQGVPEMLDRLNSPVKVLRQNNPADKRSFNLISLSHDNIEEVVI
jgi:hypothetical protein